jgi:putative acyl-CoA dehydrogenase
VAWPSRQGLASVIGRQGADAAAVSWEGSGNVAALDVLRAVAREPGSVEALFAELGLAAGGDRRLDGAVLELKDMPTEGPAESAGRRVAERIAVTLQGSLLVRYAPPVVADAFCPTRLGGD